MTGRMRLSRTTRVGIALLTMAALGLGASSARAAITPPNPSQAGLIGSNPLVYVVPPAVQSWVQQNAGNFQTYVLGNSTSGNQFASSIASAPAAVKTWFSQNINNGGASPSGQALTDMMQSLGVAQQATHQVQAAQAQLDALAQQGLTDPNVYPVVAQAQAQLQSAQAVFNQADSDYKSSVAMQQWVTSSIQAVLQGGYAPPPPPGAQISHVDPGATAQTMNYYLKSLDPADLQKLLTGGTSSVPWKNIVDSGVDDGSGDASDVAAQAALQAQLDQLSAQIAQTQPQSTGLNSLIDSGTSFSSVQLQTIYTNSQLANYQGPSSAGLGGFNAVPWLSPTGTGVSSGGPAEIGSNLTTSTGGAALCGN